jgi:hypothetical protein
MSEHAFELLGRQVEDGGVTLVFRCSSCGGECRLFLRDDDPLKERYLVSCACGAQVNMYFGSPLVGRALLRSLKRCPETPEEYHRCPAPMLN